MSQILLYEVANVEVAANAGSKIIFARKSLNEWNGKSENCIIQKSSQKRSTQFPTHSKLIKKQFLTKSLSSSQINQEHIFPNHPNCFPTLSQEHACDTPSLTLIYPFNPLHMPHIHPPTTQYPRSDSYESRSH